MAQEGGTGVSCGRAHLVVTGLVHCSTEGNQRRMAPTTACDEFSGQLLEVCSGQLLEVWQTGIWLIPKATPGDARLISLTADPENFGGVADMCLDAVTIKRQRGAGGLQSQWSVEIDPAAGHIQGL
eukprot:4409118-Amphidinium_carterae.1